MDRLQGEVHRLYAVTAEAGAAAPGSPTPLVDAAGRVRTLVLALTQPADWPALSVLWRGVQTELELPAPAIAVSGVDSLQLWFSLAQARPAAEVAAFGAALIARHLPALPARRLRCWPAAEGVASVAPWFGAPPPALQAGSGRWSAYVAPDLAGVFGEEPGLDGPPSASGQADLLSRLGSIGPADFDRALALLQPEPEPAAPAPTTATATATATAIARAEAPARAPVAGRTPQAFLHDVMNDERVDLRLRIEAARALLGAAAQAAPAAE